ncbi:MAG: NAD(P)/FAD-dependent oxidoreductase [Clostridia bacterium]|nr:NAD(P)/FAD-dependent oxidoreductase [Clostridia bacterium]
MNKVAVLGGGASGIIAAITAARRGSEVAILEKNSRIGKKLLMTGNGRCNITNMNLKAENYNSAFVCDALNTFSAKDTIEFFKEIGLLTYEEQEGRVYPVSNQASAVLEVLRLEIERQNVTVVCDFDITKIEKYSDGFFIYSKNGEKIAANRIIVALGGKSAQNTGSDGSGYRLLTDLGHSVKTPDKALVQLKTDKSIKGVRAYAKASVNGIEEKGEVQFTGYGLSGIPILNLSRYAKSGDVLTLDMMPDYTEDELFEYLQKRHNQNLETYLIGMLNKPLGQMLLKECDIGKLSRKSESLEDFEIKKIAKKLKGWSFIVTGKMGWDNAQVTMGGIELSEIDSKTMESKIVKNCYITGEMMDIDAECGGFNLQWAWSSGFAAGKNAAKTEESDEV